MKKKSILLGLAAVLVAAVALGGTWAAFDKETDPKNPGTMDIQAKNLGIDWDMEEAEKDFDESFQGAPGEETAKVYRVKNTNDYALYTRVTIYKTLEKAQAEGSKEEVAEEAANPAALLSLWYEDTNLTEQDEEGNYIQVGKTLANGWYIAYVDDEQITAYYTEAVPSKGVTTDLMDTLKLSADMDNSFKGAMLELTADADAVQQTGETEVDQAAMASEWGVYLNFDADGNFESITE